jgi:hypothetical protein
MGPEGKMGGRGMPALEGGLSSSMFIYIYIYVIKCLLRASANKCDTEKEQT